MKVAIVWKIEGAIELDESDKAIKILQEMIDKINETKQWPGVQTVVFEVRPDTVYTGFIPLPGWEIDKDMKVQ